MESTRRQTKRLRDRQKPRHVLGVGTSLPVLFSHVGRRGRTHLSPPTAPRQGRNFFQTNLRRTTSQRGDASVHALSMANSCCERYRRLRPATVASLIMFAVALLTGLMGCRLAEGAPSHLTGGAGRTVRDTKSDATVSRHNKNRTDPMLGSKSGIIREIHGLKEEVHVSLGPEAGATPTASPLSKLNQSSIRRRNWDEAERCRLTKYDEEVAFPGCTAKPVKLKLSRCSGECWSYMKPTEHGFTAHCKCCQPSRHNMEELTVTCDDGESTRTLSVPTSCKCRSCPSRSHKRRSSSSSA